MAAKVRGTRKAEVINRWQLWAIVGCYCGGRGGWLKRHEKEQFGGESEVDEGAVTGNQKSISRRSFPQLVHTNSEHKFFGFFVASRLAT
jgi:hypothetical protein